MTTRLSDRWVDDPILNYWVRDDDPMPELTDDERRSAEAAAYDEWLFEGPIHDA